jgi:TRAP-type C4-dicarboxylate transport system substrate-binding protein
MTLIFNFRKAVLLFAGIVVLTSWFPKQSGAAEPNLIKLATPASRNSVYHRLLLEMCETLRSHLGPQARCLVYPESIQGSESDMIRRMRVGQLDAALLSVVGLHDIDPSVGVLQYMPMMFRSWDEVDYVREQLRPVIEEKLRAKGFVILFWGEGGWVQFFTKVPISTPEEFRKGKVFALSGDSAQINIMKTLGFTPVGMQITDILPGLETGMIDILPVASIWTLAGQFDRVTRYMLPINWAPIIGAVIMRSETYEALPPAARQALSETSRASTEKLRAIRTVQEVDAIKALQARGMILQKLTPETEREWKEVAEKIWEKERDTMVPGSMADLVKASLEEYRRKAKK